MRSPATLPAPLPALPTLEFDLLDVRASFDYVKLHYPIRAKSRFAPDPRYRWAYTKGASKCTLTVHDPAPADLRTVCDRLDDPLIAEIEISVDLWPAADVPMEERAQLLERTFVALALRFRPDDELAHGAGFKGAFSAGWVGAKPFHRRWAKPGETLVYSHRGEGHGAKLYLKNRDQGRHLPPEQHRVRIETTMRSPKGLHFKPFGQLSSLSNGLLRRHFAKVFRIIDRPEVRKPSRYTAEKLAEHNERMMSMWMKAGVGAFAQRPLPADATPWAKAASKYREDETLPLDVYRLRRDIAANAIIGERLRKLDRQMVASFSGRS